MKKSKNKGFLILFTISLLIFTNFIRSGILVDKSYLPRFLLLAVLLLIVYLFRFNRAQKSTNGFFELIFILFFLWNFMSCLWAISISEAIAQSQLVFLGFALFLVISTFQEENKNFEGIFIKTHLFSLLISFFLGFYKMFTLEFYDPYKIISVSANNNLYSGFLLLSLPFSLTGYSLFKGLWKYISLSVTLFSLFFIIIIQSRAGYLGLFLSLVIVFFLLLYKYRWVFSKKNIITGVISFVLLFTGIFLFYRSLDSTRQHYFMSKVPVWSYFKSYSDENLEMMKKKRLETIATNTQMAAFDFSEDYYENANLRVVFWGKSFLMIKSHPLTGVGAGNWRIVVPSCKKPANPNHTLKNYTYSQPHNEWIGILSELGAIGLFIALFLFFLPPFRAIRRVMTGINTPSVSVVFYASFVLGFYLFSCFDFPLKRIEHNVLLFSIFGFLLQKISMKLLITDQRSIKLRLKIFYHSKLRKINPSTSSPSPLLLKEKGTGVEAEIFNTLALCAFAVKKKTVKIETAFLQFTSKYAKSMNLVIIILLLFTVFVGLARFKGEYFTLKMFRNERQNDEKVIQFCFRAENPFYTITPNTLPVAWFEGVAHYRLGKINEAIPCFERALKSTPFEVRVLNDYGISLFNLNRMDEAKSVLLNTISIDPFFDDAKFNLGAIYYLTGQRDSASYYITRCRDSKKKSEFLEEMKQDGEVVKW